MNVAKELPQIFRSFSNITISLFEITICKYFSWIFKKQEEDQFICRHLQNTQAIMIKFWINHSTISTILLKLCAVCGWGCCNQRVQTFILIKNVLPWEIEYAFSFRKRKEHSEALSLFIFEMILTFKTVVSAIKLYTRDLPDKPAEEWLL